MRRGLQCLFAEALGTFVLTFVAAGALMAGILSHGEVDHVAKSVAPGLVVTALIYALGDVSGAHFNPAVTLAFALRRDFRWSRVPGYWAAQLVGATGAALLLRYLLGSVAHIGATQTDLSDGKTVVLEAILAVILVTVILNAASQHSLIGTDAAIAVGATISFCGLFAGTLTGASMNPARSFGPSVVSGHADKLWLYIVGPLAGAIVAVLFSVLLHPRRDREERDAAEGKSSAGRGHGL
ncbi:MAG: aquaporin [Actinomycetota bacterium]|nr:aquaporin [Actinomycetota bacterium]